MSTKKRVVCAVVAAAAGISLLCGFGFAKKEYVYKQFETAEPVTSVAVTDASAKVTIQTADTDRITVRYAELPEEEPLYDISVQDGQLVVRVRDDVDVDTRDDGPALVRVRIEGHSIDAMPDRELTVTLPDKQYDQLEAVLAVGTLDVQGVDAKELSVESAVGDVEVTGVQAEQIELASATGKVTLRDARAQEVDVGAAVGSAKIENLTAEKQLSVAGAVGSVSLKQVTAGNVDIGTVIGSIKLQDVVADSYSKVGLFVWNRGRVQHR